MRWRDHGLGSRTISITDRLTYPLSYLTRTGSAVERARSLARKASSKGNKAWQAASVGPHASCMSFSSYDDTRIHEGAVNGPLGPR